jgi:hypothetical protein
MSHQIFFAAGLDEQFAVIFVLRKALKRVWNSGARKTLEHFQPIAFQSSIVADPERRIDRKRVNVRQKIARLIHHVDGNVAIWNADVNMQSENQVRPGQQLHVLYNLLITLAFSDELVAPMRERMRADGRDF